MIYKNLYLLQTLDKKNHFHFWVGLNFLYLMSLQLKVWQWYFSSVILAKYTHYILEGICIWRTLLHIDLRLKTTPILYPGVDDTSIAVGLGYTVHAVLMMSQILDFPVRYPMMHLSSRSTIMDHIHPKLDDKDKVWVWYTCIIFYAPWKSI